MISDDDLYRLAIFLGSVAMVLIVLYHFFEVNSQEGSALAEKAVKATPAQQPQAVGKQKGIGLSWTASEHAKTTWALVRPGSIGGMGA
ncbi:Oligosaccaryltransferase-domain-containing protein [Whalleya microplaca]|nr:Oligosaccaryltransferase-domain-containing protein [Whalleya microplaca]